MNSFTNWDDNLYHSGIKGMKWGIRRYQNPDGTLTEEGKRRYAKNPKKLVNTYNNINIRQWGSQSDFITNSRNKYSAGFNLNRVSAKAQSISGDFSRKGLSDDEIQKNPKIKKLDKKYASYFNQLGYYDKKMRSALDEMEKWDRTKKDLYNEAVSRNYDVSLKDAIYSSEYAPGVYRTQDMHLNKSKSKR